MDNLGKLATYGYKRRRQTK